MAELASPVVAPVKPAVAAPTPAPLPLGAMPPDLDDPMGGMNTSGDLGGGSPQAARDAFDWMTDAPLTGGGSCEDTGGGWCEPAAEPETGVDAAKKIRDLSFWYHAEDQNAGGEAVNTLNRLPDAEKLAAIEDLSPEEVSELAGAIPADRRVELEYLAKNCTDPQKKLQLWAKYHSGRAVADADAINDGADDAMAKRRSLAAGRTETEMDDEVAHLIEQAGAEGRDINMTEVDELIARKELEHEIEMTYNVDLSNDTVLDIAGYNKGDQNRTRKTWSKEELELMKPELAKMTDEQRAGVKEFRRASADHDNETGKKRGIPAQASSDGIIEMFGETLVDSSDPAKPKLKQAGVLVHEVGHQVDNNNTELSDRYKQAASFRDYADADAMKAHLTRLHGAAAAEKAMKELASKSGVGRYGEQSVVVDGVVYQASKDADDNVTYDSYNADALPSRGYTEKTTDGWGDEHDYARTNQADMFADHFKLAARDPVRLHSDYIDGPAQEIADLEAKLKAEAASGGAKPETQEKLALAKKRQETLQGQYDLMREEVNGVTQDVVEEAGANIPTELLADYEEQAKRCNTQDQLQKLASLYETGQQVDGAVIIARSAALPPTVSAADRAAFEADAARCFTPDQLDKLAASYTNGTRHNGQWTNKARGEDALLGY